MRRRRSRPSVIFLDEPPEEKLPAPDFRTLENRPLRRPSPNLLETIYTMQRRKEWMREYLAGLGAVPLEFIGSATDRTSALTVARTIRETLGLVDGWAQELRRLHVELQWREPE